MSCALLAACAIGCGTSDSPAQAAAAGGNDAGGVDADASVPDVGAGGVGGGTGGTADAGGNAGDANSEADSASDVEFTYDAPPPDGSEPCMTLVEVKPTAVSLDLFFLLDTSSELDGTRISELRQGVTNLAGEAALVGMGVSGQHFGLGGLNESCNSSDYSTPSVPWTQLPAASFTSWVSALEAVGHAPSVPALEGAVNACKARLVQQPSHKCVVVLVTAGLPTGNCPPVGAAAKTPLGSIAASSCASGVPVFSISFPNLPVLEQSIVDEVALQGCTGTAYTIQGGSMSSDVVPQLEQLARGCEIPMPVLQSGLYDPEKVELYFTPGNGQPRYLISRVSGVGQCNGEDWYYDDNAAPTHFLLCPAACAKVNADKDGKLQANLGCQID